MESPFELGNQVVIYGDFPYYRADSLWVLESSKAPAAMSMRSSVVIVLPIAWLTSCATCSKESSTRLSNTPNLMELPYSLNPISNHCSTISGSIIVFPPLPEAEKSLPEEGYLRMGHLT